MKKARFKDRIKKIKLITLDGDGCLFSYENVGSKFHSSWDALGFAYGLKDEWDKRIEIFYKKGDDLEWAEADAADLKGREIEKAEKALYPIPYCNGAREFAERTKGRLLRGLLSAAIDIVAGEAYKELELDFSFHNILHRNNGFFTGTLDYNVPTWRKYERLPEICERYNIQLEEICHVGDNENDVDVGKRVGLFIALKPKKQDVEKSAHCVANDFF